MSERQQIEAVAARWLMRRGEPDWTAADAAELDGWLDVSFAHKAAFWRLEEGWREADRIAAVAPPAPRRRSVWRARPLRWMPPAALAASLVAALALPLWLARSPDDMSRAFHTRVGQTSEIRTEDGSLIELNTGTALRTRVVAGSRDAWLDQGEAFFDIHHEEGRPFRVHAGPKTITVLGTRFSVRRDGDKVTVAVVSGRVRIEDTIPPAAAPLPVVATRSATVTAGDVAVAVGSSTLVAADASVRMQELTAWRDGMAIFDQTPLSDAVAEFNRYSATPIVIDEPAVAQFRIGGSFRVENSAGFLRLLQSAYGLNVRHERDAIHVYR